MKRKHALGFLLTLLLVTCDDENETQFEENYHHNIAVIKDDVMDTSPVPAKGVRIFLTNVDKDTTRYTIFTTTDSTGGFYFNDLPKKRSDYYFYVHYILRGIIFQSSFVKLTDIATKDSIIIKPRYTPGIRLVVTDSISGNIMPLATVCLFNNGIFTENTQCSGSIASKTTNSAGIVYFADLDKGTSYTAVVSQTVGKIPIEGRKTILFSSDSIQTEELKIQQSGISVTVTDMTSGDPVPNIPVCLFTNKTFASDTTCTNSVKSLQTDAYGRVFFDGLQTASHYLVLNDTLKSIIFKGLKEVTYETGKHLNVNFQVNSRKK